MTNKRRTWHLKIISLLMAILLWVFITNENIIFNKKDIPGVKVNVINLGSGLAAAYPNEVRVSITGTPHSAGDIYAYIDLKDKGVGDYDLPIEVKPMSGTNISSVDPSRVKVEIKEVRENIFPVTYRISTPPPDGYQVAGVEFAPARCIVRGGEDLVDRIASLQAELDLSQVMDTASISVKVTPIDKNQRPMPESLTVVPEKVQAYVIVEKKQTFSKASIIPEFSGALPSGYQTGTVVSDPIEVKLLGAANSVVGIENVATEPIDLTGKTASFEQKVKLVAPDGVNVFPAEVTVMVEVKTAG